MKYNKNQFGYVTEKVVKLVNEFIGREMTHNENHILNEMLFYILSNDRVELPNYFISDVERLQKEKKERKIAKLKKELDELENKKGVV